MTANRFALRRCTGVLRRIRSGIWLSLALSLVFAVSTIAMACTPGWLQATSAGGNGFTIANAIKVAADNDQVVTGRFSLSANFAGTTLVSEGGSDIFLARYSAWGGKLLWAISAGGPADDQGVALDLDREGNIYVTGVFTDSATFGSTDHKAKTVQGVGQTIFIAKYSPSGHLLWIETGVSPANWTTNSGNGIAVDSAARTVYLTALAQENTTFSSENGTSDTVSGVGTWHMVLAKYDTDGNFQWAQTNYADPNSVPYGVGVDGGGNAYVVGWLEDTATFTSANGKDVTVTGFSPAQTTTDYPDDAFLAKYDRDGNVEWVNHIGGYKAIGNAVAVSHDGEVSIAGLIGNIDYGSAGEAKTIATSQPPGTSIDLGGGDFTDPYNPDAFVATYTTSGVLLRAFRYGGSGDEIATAITYNGRGSLLIAGLSRQGSGNPTLFVQKYWRGRLLWQQTAENAGIWSAAGTTPGIAVDPAGNAFVTGGFAGTADFGAIQRTGLGSSNMFIAELAHE
jgi:hypothetical protein